MSEDISKRLFGRQRRANVVGGRQHSHKVKVTPEEEAILLALAHERSVSIPRLLVESAMAGPAIETITERRQLGVELTEIRRLLATIANNTNQIAKYANLEGVVPDWAEGVAADYTALRPQINAIVDGLARQ